MKKLLLIGAVLFTIQATKTNSFAQTKEPATIFIYRLSKFVAGAVPANIEFNNIGICQLRNNSMIKYKMYSEGRVNITATALVNMTTAKASTNLNVKLGNTYFISLELSMTGVILDINTKDGEREINRISDKKIVSLEEDIESPIIEKSIKQQLASVNQQVGIVEKQKNEYSYKSVSDIDINIPSNITNSSLQFALIIGNEDYTSFQNDLKNEMNVEFARNDASAFREYAIKTLGIPEKNITFILDGTAGQINQALNKLNLIAKNTNGKASLILYYAGHGLPNETTKEPYLIPVDVSGTDLSLGIKLKDLYFKLTEYPCKRVLVFLDACFTGGARNQGLISARGVKVKPKEELLKGNIIVFSSSSEDQSSLPFKEKQHGLFTYYLLKKFQETNGNVKLKDLSSYLKEQVSLESVVSNNKEQNPQINSSSDILNEWSDWNLNF